MRSRPKIFNRLEVKTFSFLTTALLSAGLFLSSSLWAEEDIKYPSPDGRFALRITESKDNEDHPTVELIEKESGKVMVTLHSGSDTDVFDASESVLVWSGDSKRVAYGFRPNPPGCESRRAECVHLFLERLRFRQSIFA